MRSLKYKNKLSEKLKKKRKIKSYGAYFISQFVIPPIINVGVIITAIGGGINIIIIVMVMN